MDTTDLNLLRAHVGGDESAFGLLIARHERWIFAAARRRLNDHHLADDARQAVFLLLAERAVALVGAGVPSVSAWLFQVMIFTCSSIRRTRMRQARHETATSELPRAEANVADDARMTLLEDTIAQLPPRDREAVVRRFYQCESFAEVGRALGITEEAARKRVTRILRRCRVSLSLEGIDARPMALLDGRASLPQAPPYARASAGNLQEIERVAKGAMNMVQQTEAMQFAVMTAEFVVRSVEDNLDFFEKLGFRRHYVETLDAGGVAPRASLRGGHARIWLRRATKENSPSPGVVVYVWLDGGEQAVIRHRETIAAQGVAVNQFFYDGTLMNFTVTSPDGYAIGFFSTYKPHQFDLPSDG
jgi:RNA polymerase sigma factor (sigma-70 family)